MNIRYKFQKLNKSGELESSRKKEIQINKFKYRIDHNSKHMLEFMGAPGSGSTDGVGMDSKKQFQHLMKMDKVECEYSE